MATDENVDDMSPVPDEFWTRERVEQLPLGGVSFDRTVELRLLMYKHGTDIPNMTPVEKALVERMDQENIPEEVIPYW